MSRNAGATARTSSGRAVKEREATFLGLPFALTEAESEVVAAAAAGRIADPGQDRGAPPHVEARSGWAGRRVRARVVATLCTHPSAELHAHGVRIAHAHIEGSLDLQNAKLRVPLCLEGCRVDHPVVLEDAEAPAVTLNACALSKGIAAARLRTDGSLTLTRSVIGGGVEVFDAKIGGDLDCRDMRLTGDGDDPGLIAMGIEVGADVALNGCTVVEGGVSFLEATIGRSLYADGAELSNTGDAALTVEGSEIHGDVSLDPGPCPSLDEGNGPVRRFTAHGQVSLSRARAALVTCRGARLESDVSALNLWGAEVGRDVRLSPWIGDVDAEGPLRAELRGHVDLRTATIGGDVDLSGASVEEGVVAGNRADVGGVINLGVAQDDQGRGLADGRGGIITFECRSAWLSASRVGQLVACGGRLGGQDETVLDLSDSEVAGGVLLDAWVGEDTAGNAVSQVTELGGTTDLHAARLSTVSGRGAHFTAREGTALSLWGAHVTGDVDLRVKPTTGSSIGTKVEGTVEMTRAIIDGDLVLQDASIQGDLIGGGIQVHGRLLLDGGTSGALRPTVDGRIDLSGGKLSTLYLSGLKLTVAPSAVALNLSGASIAGDVLLNPVLASAPDGELGTPVTVCSEVQGSILLSGARVEGDVVAGGARLVAEPTALDARQLTVGGNVSLNVARSGGGGVIQSADGNPARFDATGETSFYNASIKGQLSCRGGRFHNPEGDALTLYGVDVVGDVLLDESADAPAFEADGRVSLMSAEIGHNLTLRGARITNCRGVTDASEFTALNATNLRVVNHLALDRLVATGVVDLRSAQAGALECTGARFQFPEGWVAGGAAVFDGRYMQVANELTWDQVYCDGPVNLAHATVGSLRDDLSSWPPGGTELEGFGYGALAPDTGWKQRTEWLARQPVPLPQPYHQLAAQYRAAGDDRAARKVNMERFNVRLRHPQPGDRRAARAWRWLLRVTIGHGYEPWRALPFLLAVIAVVWATTALAAHNGDMVPTRAGVSTERAATDCTRTDYPCLQPVLYATDVVVPVVDFGQRGSWHQAGGIGYRIIPPLGTLLGWLLTTLVVAGFTGVVRRE